jgi:hypothetical protein
MAMGKYAVSVGFGKKQRSETRNSAILAELWVDEFEDRYGRNHVISVFDDAAGVRISGDQLRSRAAQERKDAVAAHNEDGQQNA